MDVTARARSLLEPVPAHRTAGITVVRAADGAAEVALVAPPGLANVIGSLHSSGLIALADAAGLAAVIAASRTVRDFAGVLPLGAAATMEFLAPARGRLLASCTLGEQARQALSLLFSGEQDRARVTTVAGIPMRPASWYAGQPSSGASAGAARLRPGPQIRTSRDAGVSASCGAGLVRPAPVSPVRRA